MKLGIYLYSFAGLSQFMIEKGEVTLKTCGRVQLKITFSPPQLLPSAGESVLTRAAHSKTDNESEDSAVICAAWHINVN